MKEEGAKYCEMSVFSILQIITVYVPKKSNILQQNVSVLQHPANVISTPSSFALSGTFKLRRFDARDFGQWAGMFQDLLRVEHRRVCGHLPRTQMPRMVTFHSIPRHIMTHAELQWWFCLHNQVVPGTRRCGSFEKGTWLIGILGELERSELKWNEAHEMKKLNHLKSMSRN